MTLIVGFGLALVLLAVGVLVGILLAADYNDDVARRRARQVEARWRALQAANRLQMAFWVARRAMRREGERVRDEE
jgi:hypothetical protein